MVKPDAYSYEHYIAHGVIFLHHFLKQTKLVRGVLVIKMKGTKHSDEMMQMMFTKDGLTVLNQNVLKA